MSEPNRDRMPSQNLATLILSASSECRLSRPDVNIDDIETLSTPSQSALAAFAKHFPEMAQEFAKRAGFDAADIPSAIRQDLPEEPQPEPPVLPENATDEQIRLFEIKMEARKKREAAPMTRPMVAAIRAGKQVAADSGAERCELGHFLAALLETESNARDIIRRLSNPGLLPEALLWLKTASTPTETPDFRAITQQYMRQTMDREWPRIQKENRSARHEEAREVAYANNPSLYEEPLDIAARLASVSVPPEKQYTLCCGVYLHAAANEARIRRSPEILLDHMLVAVLRDGSCTARFLDQLHVDRQEWARILDAELPNHADGPRWPPNSRALGMCIPSNQVFRFNSPPNGVAIEDLPAEEAKQYIVRSVDLERQFTDLSFFANVLDEPETIACRLFREAAICQDDIGAEIKAVETGDRNWWNKEPDLAAHLREAKASDKNGSYHGIAARIAEASTYVARMRGAEKVEASDVAIALLIPESDLWTLVTSHGNDPQLLTHEIQEAQTRFPIKVMFPEKFFPAELALEIHHGRFSDLVVFHHLLSRARYFDADIVRILSEAGVTLESITVRLNEMGIEV